MSTPQDLLKRWAELEPERCNSFSQANQYTLLIDGVPTAVLKTKQGMLACLLTAVLEAITTHNLRLKLENDGKGQWHSLLMFTELQAAFLGSNPEPAIAILEAYLDWLEFGREDIEADAGGES